MLADLPGIAAGIDHLCGADPDFARVMQRFGPLHFTLKPGGYAGLLRIILGQQVSVQSADAIWQKLKDRIEDISPANLHAIDEEALRACGLSRQKIRYVKGLAADVLEGSLDIEGLKSLDDEAAIARITRCIGLGRWTAENYLLFCEGRADLFPAKDLAILIGLEWLKALPARPTPAEAWAHAARWQPHRSAATLMIWHHYIGEVALKRLSRKSPLAKVQGE
jgi:DNA-3-methyladenine glycosylase II